MCGMNVIRYELSAGRGYNIVRISKMGTSSVQYDYHRAGRKPNSIMSVMSVTSLPIVFALKLRD